MPAGALRSRRPSCSGSHLLLNLICKAINKIYTIREQELEQEIKTMNDAYLKACDVIEDVMSDLESCAIRYQ